PVGVTLEPGVRGSVFTLREHRLYAIGTEVGVELRPERTDHAVRRPAVHVVRRLAEMRARVDVVVLGGHDMVPVAGLHGRRDGAGHRGATGHRQRTALAEIVLDVDDDQGSAHDAPFEGWKTTGTAGSPAESFRPSHGMEMRHWRRCSRESPRVGRSGT